VHKLLSMSDAEEAANMPKRIKKHIVRQFVLRTAGSRPCENLSIEQLEFPAFEAKLQIRDGAVHHLGTVPSQGLLLIEASFSASVYTLNRSDWPQVRSTKGSRRSGTYEAADSDLLSPELAAGIRRIEGVKQLGCRAGNCLNREQARLILEKSNGEGLRNIRDVAMISILLGCGLHLQTAVVTLAKHLRSQGRAMSETEKTKPTPAAMVLHEKPVTFELLDEWFLFTRHVYDAHQAVIRQQGLKAGVMIGITGSPPHDYCELSARGPCESPRTPRITLKSEIESFKQVHPRSVGSGRSTPPIHLKGPRTNSPVPSSV
jgi:hypothetical protein